MKTILFAAAFSVAVLSSLAQATVTGARAEVFGTSWQSASFRSWAEEENALLNPEVTHLALQSCFRGAQENLDAQAYAVANRLVGEMGSSFRSPGLAYGAELTALSDLLHVVNAIALDGNRARASDYTAQCKQVVKDELSRSRDSLAPLFYGRMHPKVPPELRAKGLKLLPLTWDGLEDSICTLEGYYSTSNDPRLWKFFSLTRAMGNVLPAERDNDSFVKAVMSAPAVVKDIGILNVYSAVAGKYNGASIGMTADEMRQAPVRMTGPALGSKATALMAFFTTGWREQLQRLIIERDYQPANPAKPFRLLSAQEVAQSVRMTFDDKSVGSQKSQTEKGMDLLWSDALAGVFGNRAADESEGVYGTSTSDYLRTYGLAWLALNAETNIRANEKLGGVGGASMPPPITRLVIGSPDAYAAMATEVAAAKTAYSTMGAEQIAGCVNAAETFLAAAQGIEEGKVQSVGTDAARFFEAVKMEPVIADIGAEVSDPRDGDFRLELAMGYGHQLPTSIGNRDYTIWVPSAEVLHTAKMLTTAQWQAGMVKQYDQGR